MRHLPPNFGRFFARAADVGQPTRALAWSTIRIGSHYRCVHEGVTWDVTRAGPRLWAVRVDAQDTICDFETAAAAKRYAAGAVACLRHRGYDPQ